MTTITEQDKSNFIGKLSPHAIQGWNDYKILPSLTIAQAILESGWETNNKIPNNLFGIKADSSWKGKKKLVPTFEYVNGIKIPIMAWFRVYDNIYDSLKDRYTFLQKPRYKAIVGEKDYRSACHAIHRAGYATDINYANLLIDIIVKNKLYEIDKMAFNIDNVSDWARESWAWCISVGLLDGNNPKKSLTREEFSKILERILKKDGEVNGRLN